MHLRPKSLDEATAFLAAERAVVMAGGTDLYPAWVDKPQPARILDITAIAGLRGIARGADYWRIGGATTWTDIVRAPLPPGFAGTTGYHDAFGPGTRIPALVISAAFTRSGVDHTVYDTTSIMASIEHRLGLRPVTTRDAHVNDLAPALARGGLRLR